MNTLSKHTFVCCANGRGWCIYDGDFEIDFGHETFDIARCTLEQILWLEEVYSPPRV